MSNNKSKRIRKLDPANTYISKMISKKIIGINALEYIQSYKYDNSYGDIIKLYEKLPHMYDSLIKNILLPQNIKLLNRGIFGYNIDNLEANFNESIAFLKLYNSEIEKFLKFKEDFEFNFLFGKYELCENILDDSKKEISYSNWYLYHMFLVKEYKGGFDSNFSYLKEIISSGAEHPIHGIFAFTFSRMVEKDLSIKNFQKYVEVEVYNFYNLKKDSKIRSFLKSYIEPFEIYFHENINDIFIGEEGCSIIDRYINLRKFMINLLHTNKEECKKYLVKILKFTNDSFFYRMHVLLTGETTYLGTNTLESKLLFEILDLYTIGDYKKCIELSSNYLEKFGLSIDVIEINLKSHINLGIEFEIVNKNNIYYDVMILIYNVLKKNDLAVESLISLTNISFSLHNFNLSIQIQYFVNKTINSSNYKFYKRVYPLFTKSLTPKIINEYSSNKKKILIENFSKIYKSSNTIDFFSTLIDFEVENHFDKTKNSIPESRILLHLSKILLEKKMYLDVIKNLEPLRGKLVNQPHLQEEYLKRIYEAYSKEDQIIQCIEIYIENYFINKHLLDNIEYSTEVKFINDVGYKTLHINIDLVLYAHICKASSTVTPLIYKRFMNKIKTDKPSNIDIKSFEKRKLVYFLKNICIQNTLSRDVRNFKTLNDIYLERVKICQLLIKIDEPNRNIYIDEIIHITKTIKIKERIRDIDNSRIYVDINGLNEYDLKDFSKNFSRYKRIKSLKDEATDDLFIMVSNGVDSDFEKSLNYKKKYLTQDDALSKIFVELFMEIRDKYLFSNENGLDSYLSTRIRHGTITGQLRTVFNELNLITTKDSNTNIYLDNNKLIKKLSIDEKYLNKFNLIMNKFSNDIDDYITFIKNSFIQIKTENISDALFNYSIYDNFNNYIILHYYNNFSSNIDDFENFIEISIEMCDLITDHNLEMIVKFFHENIKVHFFNLLEALEKEISFFDDKSFSPLLNDIRKSRTEIQKAIELVSSWFVRKKSRNVDFLLSDVLDTTEEIMHNLFPNIKLSIDSTICNKELFKGEYFTSFVDCFKIFVENIIKYSMSQNVISHP